MKWRLAARIITGGGTASLLRLLLTSVGIAVVTVAGLLAWSVPHASGSIASRTAARAAVAAPPDSAGAARIQLLDDAVGTTSLTRVLIDQSQPAPAATATATSRLPPPVGCAAVPDPGTACVSAALAALLQHDPRLAQRLGITTTTTIDATGLATPDELLTYQGVSDLDGSGTPITGWGPTGQLQVGGSADLSIGLLGLELAVLVGIPALLFLVVAARLSASTRNQRLRALRLLGLTRSELGFLAAAEGRVAGAVGGVVGAAIALVLNATIARSNIVGFRWFAADTTLPIWASFVVVAVCAWAAGRISHAGAGRETTTVRPGAASRWRLLPYWLSTTAGLTVIIVLVAKPLGGTGFLLAAAVAAVSVAALLWAQRPLVELVAHVLARPGSPLWWRLGLARLNYDSAGPLRVMTGLVALTVAASVGLGVLRDAQLAASPNGRGLTVSVPTAAADDQQRAELAQIPDYPSAVVASSEPTIQPGQSPSQDPGVAAAQFGVPITFASCVSLARYYDGAVTGCRDGASFQLASGGPDGFPAVLQPGSPLPVATDTGTAQLVVPADILTLPNLDAPIIAIHGILVTEPPPPDWVPNASVAFLIQGLDELAALQQRVGTVGADLAVDLSSLNLPQIRVDDVHRTVIVDGIALGAVLALLAFLVAVADRAHENRRNIAALRALGMPRRTIRLAQASQLTLASLVGLLAASVTGSLAATGYLVAGHLQQGWYAPPTLVALLITAAGVTLAAIGSQALSRAADPALLHGE